jgi:hypothetical protein
MFGILVVSAGPLGPLHNGISSVYYNKLYYDKLYLNPVRKGQGQQGMFVLLECV